VSECANQEFSELVGFAARGKRGAESAFVSGEAAFGLGAVTVLSIGKAVMHHSAIAPFRRPGGVSRIERNGRAANSEFLATEHVIVLGIVAFVGQEAAWSKIHSRLPDGVWKVGRVLTRTARRDGTYDQLRICVKHSRELRPGGVRRLGSTASPLEVHRGVPRFQASRVNCCGAVAIIGNQTAGASTVAASGQKLFKPPFSRSFCSTCQSVE
jgi:hypothetical protein